jgi:hypothetical protein
MAGWKLSALLGELRRGRLHDMSAQVSGAASDYLWSDDQLVRYLNEAQRRFARRSLCIRDGTTPSVTQITTIDGTATTPWTLEYALHPSVIAVLSVRMGQDPVTGQWDNCDLARAGHDAFSNYHQPDSYFFNPTMLSNVEPGKPLAWSTDEDIIADPNGSFSVMNLRLYPVVSTAYAGMKATLRVIREPINDLTLSNLNAYPEIPASHHLDMIDWAAYLALSSVDTDVAGSGADVRADKFAARFEQHCQDAKREVMRKLFTPLQWGFGSNGFTWEPAL